MDCKLQMTAAILAGGQNSRFGGEIKSLQLLNGQRIIEHQLRILDKVFEEVVIIANDKKAFKDFSSYNIYTDLHTNKGPLGGIHAALNLASYNKVFIVAGDMPFINDVTILTQASIFEREVSDALVPTQNNRLEPLHGFYSRNVTDKLNSFLIFNTTSVRDFLKKIDASIWKVERVKDFININTLEDLAKYSS